MGADDHGTIDEDTMHLHEDQERAAALRERIAKAKATNKFGGYDPVVDQHERQLADLDHQNEQRRRSIRGVHGLDKPVFLDYGLGGRSAQDMPNQPLAPTNFPGSLPTFASGSGTNMPGAMPGGGASYTPGPVDVTGKVQADVNLHADTKVSVVFSGVPAGMTATVGNIPTISRPGVGMSMPQAAAGSQPGYDAPI